MSASLTRTSGRTRRQTPIEPPPFQSQVLPRQHARRAPSPWRTAMALPLRAIALAMRLVGMVLDAGLALVSLALLVGCHVIMWSYAFNMGPAVNCGGIGCPSWVPTRALFAMIVLAVLTYIAARILWRFRRRATGTVLLLMVTFDVAAVLLLLVHAL